MALRSAVGVRSLWDLGRTVVINLVLFLIFVSAGPVLADSDTGPAVLSNECQAQLERLTSQEGWFEQLLDPVITSSEQLVERQQLYASVNECLEKEYDSLSADERMVYVLTRYFLIFAAGLETDENQSPLYLVELDSVDMEAIELLREKAGIPPPQGYVFLRYYPTRSSMPELVRSAFEDEDVRGVTIFSRYIAILDETKELLGEQILQRQTLPDTVAHEVTHAYVNAALGSEQAKLFPTWFHEGVAIYCSGSGEDKVVILGDLTVTRTSPEDYKQYELNFEYLESEYGQDQLLALVGKAIKELRPSVMYEGLGYQGDEAFIAAATSWGTRQVRNRFMVGIVVVIVVFLLLWRMIAPEVKCPYCGYSGQRKEFVQGFCPSCHRVVR